jgi:hypothetical protein
VSATVTSHDIGLDALDGLSAVDSVCLFIAEDERPLKGTAGFIDWRLCGGLSRVLLAQFFTGAAQDKLLFPTDQRLPMKRIFAVGLGKSAQLTNDGLGKALSAAAQMLSRAKVDAVALELPGAGHLDDHARASALQSHFLPGFTGSKVAVLAEKGLRQVLPTR